jgi:hypothetical protein
MITVPEEWGIWISEGFCSYAQNPLNGGHWEYTVFWMRGGVIDCKMNDFLPSTHLNQEEFPMPLEAGRGASLEKNVFPIHQPTENVGHVGRTEAG